MYERLTPTPTTNPIGGNFALLAPETPEQRLRLMASPETPRSWTTWRERAEAAVGEIHRQRRIVALEAAA